MPDYFTDSGYFHLRDTVFLDQELADQILARPRPGEGNPSLEPRDPDAPPDPRPPHNPNDPPDPFEPTIDVPLVIVARQIVLSGAVVTDRDVVLIADTVDSGTATSVPLTLRYSTTALDGELTQAGQIEPPIEVQGVPPRVGRPGRTLTVLCRTLQGGGAETLGQRGGKGLRGKNERRSWCQEHFNPIEGQNPCSNVDPFELPELVGSPGGKGLPGGQGGPAGTVRVRCLTNLSGTTAGWAGVGGAGGIGGQGGLGGPNGKGNHLDADHHLLRGPDGPRGDSPAPPPPVGYPVQLVDEATLTAEIAAVTATIVVGQAGTGSVVESHSVAALWAQFRRRQAAEALRRRDPAGTLSAMAAVRRLAPGTPGDDAPEQQVRDHSTQHSVPRDLDVPADVPAFNGDLNGADAVPGQEPLDMWHELGEAIAPLLPVPDSGPPMLLSAQAVRTADTAMKPLLARMITVGEFTEQRNRATGQADDARRARKEAADARAASIDRLGHLLTDEGSAGVTVTVPALSQPLGVVTLTALVGAIGGLAPESVADESAPSGDPATLLPGDVTLLVNGSTRAAGANGRYPARPIDIAPTAMDLRHQVSDPVAWKAVLVANSTGTAVNLLAIAGQLRAALRPAGTALTDPLRLDIVGGLLELVEATHAWRLADLRLAQALSAGERVAAAELAAVTARDLPVGGSTSPLTTLVPAFLDRARAVSDVIEWRWHRLERAFDLYTLGVGPTAIDRAAHAGLFDPIDEADAVGSAEGTPPSGAAEAAARQLTRTLERISDARVLPAWRDYRKRGDLTFVNDDDVPFPAGVTFCRDAGTGCAVPAPHIFAALRNDQVAAAWFDLPLSAVQGPHREAKIRGATVVFTYDLSGESTPPDQTFQIDLRHSGLGRQLELGSGTEHVAVALPQSMSITMQREPDQDGQPLATWKGRVSVNDPPGPGQSADPRARFPAYGRGVAGGYRLTLTDWAAAAPNLLTRIEVGIDYEALQPKGTVNLSSVTLTTALRVGVTAMGRVRLTGAAPAGGTKVLLASTDPAALAVPAVVLVPPGSAETTFPVQVLKVTGPVPPTLSAATVDGVSRRASAPVSRAPALAASSRVLGDGPASTYPVAVIRVPSGPKQPAAPMVLAGRTGQVDPADPAVDPLAGTESAVHALRGDLSPIGERPIGFWPRAFAVDSSRGRVYVVHGSTVTALNAATLVPVASATIGINASMVAVDVAADLVYVSRYSHGTVHVLRGADLSVVQVFGDKPTLRGCLGIAVHPAGGRLYLARNFRIASPTATAVTMIERRPDGSHAIVRDRTVGPELLQPHEVAVDGPAGLVFVSCQGGGGVHPTLLTLDAATLQPISSVAVPGPCLSVAARPGTGIAYLAGYPGLVLVDGRAGSIALTVKAGSLPQGVAVDAVTGTAYLTDRNDHSVTRINTPATMTTGTWH